MQIHYNRPTASLAATMETANLPSPRIIILSVPHGASHQRASNALRSALLEIQPGASVEVVNALDHCRRWFRAYYNSYEIPLKYWPGLWARIERFQDQQAATSPAWLNRMGARPLLQFLNARKPDVVVSTEVGLCEMAAMFKREDHATFRLAGLELMDFHPAWIQPEVDLYLATHQDLADELMAAGATAEKVAVTGQPIDLAFLNLPDRAAARQRLQLASDEALILLLFGGAGIANPNRVLTELAKLKLFFRAVFITGRNQRLAEEIRERSRGWANWQVLGWVDNMQEWMTAADILIGKPGGSTLMEASACGLPMLAFDPHPGNEERTCAWIEKWGIGRWIRNSDDLGPTIEHLLQNPKELDLMRQRALAFARPDAARNAAKAVLKLALIESAASLQAGRAREEAR